ncbi:alpha/beta hydrolase-fold protein [Marinicauda algicola]|nr:alpha/beta hydrolase-fold protein [Marinicauda algicola]
MKPALAALLLLAACAPQGSPPAEAPGRTQEQSMTQITVIATVPEGAGEIYLTGNLDELGPWRADGLLMSGEGRERRASVLVPEGTLFEFKITGGSWDREGTGPSGTVLPNFTHRAEGEAGEARVEIVDFKHPPEAYIADPQGSGVLGTLIYWTDLDSAFLETTRHVSIWLPPGYEAEPEKRYPVLYMHDGQNLFDPRIANTGTDWGIDEAMMANVEAGLHGPAIVVGIWSTNRRGYELSPWHGGPDYARMIVEEIRPRVDAAFRTLDGPANTFTMGSSMGGLISQYLVREYPDVFGACGCVSTHVPLSPAMARDFLGLEGGPVLESPDKPYLIAEIEAGAQIPANVRMFFDHGTQTLDANYGPGHAAIRDWLLAQGLSEGEDFIVRTYEGAAHNEASWRARAGDQLAFLLAGH